MGMLRFLKPGKTGKSASMKQSSTQDSNRGDPIPVQKLKDAQDLAAQLVPDTLCDENGAAPMEFDDGLTQDDKMLAISMLDKSGRTRTSNGKVIWQVESIKDNNGGEVTPQFTCEYGWVCQTGFYPDDLNKKNQDNLLVETCLGGNKSRGIFGVFDGHGKAGTECSTYAVNHLVRNILDAPNYSSTEDITDAYTKAFEKTNIDMHAQKRLRKSNPKYFDDTHAGTTAICVLFEGTDIIVANVGDSRAVIASKKQGKLVGMPLSIDQTPYRKDERVRCQKAGAVVMTMDQLEGYKPYNPNAEDWGCEEDDDGDPPRLWLPNRGGPGVAFTRSLGDELAEKIGCHAEPEILRQTLTSDDEFLVLASDGVFEFLSTQAVVDMVSKFSEPEEAARAIVAEAYKLWLHYEVRTDDITAIVIFLKGLRRKTMLPQKRLKKSEVTGSFADLNTVLSLAKESRPVRREMSRKKREQIAAKMVDTSEDTLETPRVQTSRKFPKTDEESDQIRAAVKANFLFQHLNPEQMKEVLDAFEKVDVAPGETVIKQGEVGDRFYVVCSGEYDCFVAPSDDQGKLVSDQQQLVTTYQASESKVGNPSFGELALIYSKPRAATVVAKTTGQLWALDRVTFRKALIKRPNREIIRTLRQVPILSTLGRSQLQRLADILSEVEYEDGEQIIQQGELGDTFFVVKSGSVRCTIDDENGNVGAKGNEVMKISEGGYFGERALLQSEPRAANVYAVGHVTCLYISRSAFEEVLGSLSDIITTHSRVREMEAMGLVVLNERSRAEELESVSIESIKGKGVVATNSLGETQLVVNNITGKMYTLKTMYKSKVEEEKEIQHVLRDRQISLCLCASNVVDHGVAPLIRTFVGNAALHMLYNTTLVGDLGSFMTQPLACETSRFLAASTVNIIEVLHSHMIVCRSISPETLMLSFAGYVKLTDFRACKRLEDENDRTFTMCGTVEYLSPEQILNTGHSRHADWWSLGVLLYEMVEGKSPFKTDNKDVEILSAITSFKQDELEFSDTLPANCRDMIRKLLNVDVKSRLGFQGPGEVKGHPGFDGLAFDKIAAETYESPLAASAADAMDEILEKNRKEVDTAGGNENHRTWYANF